MSNDPARYDASDYASDIEAREPVGTVRTGPSDASNFDVVWREKRAPHRSDATTIAVESLPADIEIDDSRPVIVEQTQERAARSFATMTYHLTAGGAPVRLVGEDFKRSRILINGTSGVRIGSLPDWPFGGYMIPAGNMETEVTGEIYAWMEAGDSDGTVSAWIERN